MKIKFHAKLQQKLSVHSLKYDNSFAGLLMKRTSLWSYRKRKIVPINIKGIWVNGCRPMAPLTLKLGTGWRRGLNLKPRLL